MISRRSLITAFGSAALTPLLPAVSISALAQENGQPAGYPSSYGDLIKASQEEKAVTVYSNLAEPNWRPIIQAFAKRYPWIKVGTLDLGSSEVMTRYLAEAATGAASADLLATGSIADWIKFADAGEAMSYLSPEAPQLPQWSIPFPGIHTLSADPMVLVYNKAVVPEAMRVSSLAELAKVAEANPDMFRKKLTTYEATNSFGLSINMALIRSKGEEGWKLLEALAPSTRPVGSAGLMLDKLTTGEFVGAYFASAPAVLSRMQTGALAKLLEVKPILDATPVFLRGMAVTKRATNPASAKLLLDFLLSKEGQVAMAQSGLTPYRPDVPEEAAKGYTYQSLVKAAGESNIVRIDYDRAMLSSSADVLARWKKTFGYTA